jgi:hypothetical protein
VAAVDIAAAPVAAAVAVVAAVVAAAAAVTVGRVVRGAAAEPTRSHEPLLVRLLRLRTRCLSHAAPPVPTALRNPAHRQCPTARHSRRPQRVHLPSSPRELADAARAPCWRGH